MIQHALKQTVPLQTQGTLADGYLHALRDQTQLSERHLVQHLITRPFPHQQSPFSFSMTSGITGEN